MNLHSVYDIDKEVAIHSAYDVAFFSSGYEERCTHVPQLIPITNIKNPIIISFKELTSAPQRAKNDFYFNRHWTTSRILASSEEDHDILVCLRALISPNTRSLRILIDYSSMSRLWYASILNWARYTTSLIELEIDFMYSACTHKSPNSYSIGIRDILAVPGFEGVTTPRGQSVAIFGLGFNAFSTLCVFDRLEPDACYCYYASPAASPDYPKLTREINSEMIKNHSAATLELSLFSVAQTYRYLIELASPHRTHSNITLVPMGPKPHVLAALLTSIRLTEVGCLRVSGNRSSPEDVVTTGDIIATRMVYKRLT